MKKNSVAMLSLILIFIIFASACAREYSYGMIERDNSLTGGDLSFIYDENTHTAIFGGEGEIIAFYEEDRLAGLPKGNRIGFKIYAPIAISFSIPSNVIPTCFSKIYTFVKLILVFFMSASSNISLNF